MKQGDLLKLKFPIKINEVSYDIGTICTLIENDFTKERYLILIDGLCAYISPNFVKKHEGERNAI